MKLKKMISLTLAMCLTIMTMIPVYANNNTDEDLPVKYISSTTYVRTNSRAKIDDSYHYIFNNCSLAIRVISYAGNDDNCTKGGYAVIPSKTERFITNTVHEDGYSACYLSIRSNISGAYTTLSGLWSPDSVGSYPIANP